MSTLDLGDGGDLARKVEKLLKINRALMHRVEREQSPGGEAYSHFQAAVSLESQVRERTRALAQVLEDLQRANAELALAKTQAEQARADLSNAIGAIREGFALFGRDERLVLRNARFCSLLPDVRAQLEVGMAFDDFVEAVAASSAVVLPDREAWKESRRQAHRRSAANFVVELVGDRWLQVAEHRTGDGGTAILQTDVTDLVRLERLERDKLLDSQARLVRATLDHLGQGVAIFDSQARMIGSNRRLREFISPPIDLLRTGTSFRAIADYFQFKRQFRELEALQALMDWVMQPSRPPLALQLSTQDDVHFDLFAEETPDGGFVISLTDITAERRLTRDLHAMNESLESRVEERTAELSAARDAAQRANAARSRFVAAVSHDLLQPVNAAKLFLAALREEELPPRPAALVERIGSAFQNMEAILSALLDISRLDSGRAAVNVTNVALAPMLTALAAEFLPLARAKGLELEVAPVEEGLWVRSDATYLRRIAQNLLSNAVRYTREGRVRMSVSDTGGRLTLVVEDTGPGIPPEKHALIFQEFERGGAPESEPGMGLGLAIVDQACKVLGHALRLQSAPGQGTRFEVDLERAAPPAGTFSTRRELSGGADLGSMAVLIVENDDEVRAATANLLESWGAHTIEAESASGALQLVREIGIVPDVLIVDVHLADATGFDAVQLLRSELGQVPAILVSADHSPVVQGEAEQAGLPLLHKPVEAARLRALLVWMRARGLPVDG